MSQSKPKYFNRNWVGGFTVGLCAMVIVFFIIGIAASYFAPSELTVIPKAFDNGTAYFIVREYSNGIKVNEWQVSAPQLSGFLEEKGGLK